MEPGETSVGIAQTWQDADDDRYVGGIIRLCRPWLTTVVISHELHHIVAAMYGATLGPNVRAKSVLVNGNEPYAYFYGDLFDRIVRKIYALGYYGASK